MSEALSAGLDIVRATASGIRELEAAANAALQERGDAKAHRSAMEEKCRLLVALPDKVRKAAKGGDDDPAYVDFLEELKGFAQRAGQALSLESIFYMSALLYPEDYEDGEPNDLEMFVKGYE